MPINYNDGTSNDNDSGVMVANDDEVMEQEYSAHITLPDVTDSEAVAAFKASMQDKLATRGVTTMLKYLSKAADNMALVHSQLKRAQVSADFINGIRTQRSPAKPSLRTAASRYFSMLEGVALQKQCDLFGVPYSVGASKDALVEALVEKQLAMQEG